MARRNPVAFAAAVPALLRIGGAVAVTGRHMVPVRRCRAVRMCAQSAPGTRIGETAAERAAEQVEEKSVPRGDRLVLVGLGNTGPQYARTRHNVGFDVVGEFVSRNRASFKTEKRFQADVAVVELAGRSVHVLKPRTYMNNSGLAVRALMSYYKVPMAALLVVVDDMSLDIGRLRLRAKGSAGGHNGLKSIQKQVGTNEYCRLKVGVGAPRGGGEAWSDHVLGKFSRGEEDAMTDVTWDCMDVLEHWVREEDLAKVMNKMSSAQQTRGTR